MKITKKEFKKICNFLDRIEKPDFTKLDISDLFEDIPVKTKLEIRDNHKGIENIRVLRLLYQLESVRNKYNVKLKKED